MKITFMGAGSTVFARNILGDCIVAGTLGAFEIALFDINETRLKESYNAISAINRKYGNLVKIIASLDRKQALKGADFVVNAIQVGGYKPSTVADFEIPKKYGLRQTIADTLGIGGIMRGLRTIPVMSDFAKDMEEVCPDAIFLNYTNPMAILSGYMCRYTDIQTVGLCHSVQSVVPSLTRGMGIAACDKNKYEKTVFGINHQAWLLGLTDLDGNDLYPQIKELSENRFTLGGCGNAGHSLVRRELMRSFGYYVTESSEHSAEYLPYFIKDEYPELIKKYKIPLDEYPRRCVRQIAEWRAQRIPLMLFKKKAHTRSKEFGSYIIEAGFTGEPYTFHGNIANNGLISNLPDEACVEVPITVAGKTLTPHSCGALPNQCASLNVTSINTQLLTIEAARTLDREYVYMAAYLDPHTSASLPKDKIRQMCDELLEQHRKDGFLPEYK